MNTILLAALIASISNQAFSNSENQKKKLWE
jgi:hypothetical protein